MELRRVVWAGGIFDDLAVKPQRGHKGEEYPTFEGGHPYISGLFSRGRFVQTGRNYDFDEQPGLD
jgi:hypothetical protein